MRIKKKTKKKRTKRKGRGKSKGSAFEREICKKLSLWWTKGERDDIFWRTSGSGARAKTRSKKHQKTFGQYGDIQATDPIGQPLIDLCSIELKRGHNKSTLSDFMDSITKTKPQLQKFLEQAIKDSQLREDGSEWILLVKRDYRDVVLFIPYKFFKQLNMAFEFQGISVYKHPETKCIRINYPILNNVRCIFVCRLDWFLKRIKPKYFCKLWKKEQRWEK